MKLVVAATLLLLVTPAAGQENRRWLSDDPPPAAGGTIEAGSSYVRVIDGDTLDVKGTPVRLLAVAAPERGSVSGDLAAAFLHGMIEGHIGVVICRLTGERSYERHIGTCELVQGFDSTGLDIGGTLIGAGYAFHCPAFGDPGDYALSQLHARSKASAPFVALVRDYGLPDYCKP